MIGNENREELWQKIETSGWNPKTVSRCAVVIKIVTMWSRKAFFSSWEERKRVTEVTFNAWTSLSSVYYCPQGDCGCMSVTVAQPATVTITRDRSRWHPPPCSSCSSTVSISSVLCHRGPRQICSLVSGQVRHLMAVLEWWITLLCSDWVTYRLQYYGPVPFQS